MAGWSPHAFVASGRWLRVLHNTADQSRRRCDWTAHFFGFASATAANWPILFEATTLAMRSRSDVATDDGAGLRERSTLLDDAGDLATLSAFGEWSRWRASGPRRRLRHRSHPHAVVHRSACPDRLRLNRSIHVGSCRLTAPHDVGGSAVHLRARRTSRGCSAFLAAGTRRRRRLPVGDAILAGVGQRWS